MQPHFALSAIFLLGLRGMEKRLPLPFPPVSVQMKASQSGSVRLPEVVKLPVSLESATQQMMRKDSVAREESVFGNLFVDHFGGTREHEVRVWNEAVTNWECEFTVKAVMFSSPR
jgi:glutamine synthetase